MVPTETALCSIVQKAGKVTCNKEVALILDFDGVFDQTKPITSVNQCCLDMFQTNWMKTALRCKNTD